MYIHSLRAKHNDAPDIAINATGLSTNGRVQSNVGLHYWRVCCQAIHPLLFHRLLFLHISTTALELGLHCEHTIHIVAIIPVFHDRIDWDFDCELVVDEYRRVFRVLLPEPTS